MLVVAATSLYTKATIPRPVLALKQRVLLGAVRASLRYPLQGPKLGRPATVDGRAMKRIDVALAAGRIGFDDDAESTGTSRRPRRLS